MHKLTLLAAAAAFSFAASAAPADFLKFDPNMAVSKAVVDTNGVKWIDGRYLPIEGRMFNDVDAYYDRLPSGVTTAVNGGVRSMKHHTAGLQFRFRTNSRYLKIRYESLSGGYEGSGNLAGVARSGWDLYRFRPEYGLWRFESTSHNSTPIAGTKARIKHVSWKGGDCLINLPLYDGVRSFAIGIEPNAKIEAIEHRSGVTKPVVFYGTSITHGASAARPGLCFVNRVGRDLDVPVVNLGFSGCGWMELEMSDHLARIDASCYVLDALWNMSLTGSKRNNNVDANYEPFVRNLRAKRPDVPIVFAEQCDVYREPEDNGGRFGKKHAFVRKLFAKLKDEGWENIYYLSCDEMYEGLDAEGTIDGCHPNDLGMATMTKAFDGVLREALGLKSWYEFWK